ncbi:putative metallophosphoesterase domain-containing protein 1 [Monocercomonoides exilis]|uniref:putative metallophosphoesterase domain-containing protein 1 n=1 Tax=Monocercomonoides exilis TaxID=2049356 RepID=UPI00355A614D|nr:putative metallophosphoesterase domain-containing protein 1 [Monocercomonoides exilis]|eukprot:MONOS_7589.1-p1 / transcript=MONOS_7589.1 / gene=MONOS_7589 / organism=Monocercomonoides_exilis_PA203 / gene_product=metallophosphoesterase domain-containing protein 1 / transcript_product=metallophosphoesterase domain-containing protein 1 / location=Mono_scaffold00263:17078-18052(-) / protein_length=324 / sequence_SO=supercontig / SO=protein_coding / is_pseudo=false
MIWTQLTQKKVPGIDEELDWKSFRHDVTPLAWSVLEKREKFVEPIPYVVKNPKEQPKPEGYLRFVCISDTHGRHGHISGGLPEGDVLLHSGDFTMTGQDRENDSFAEFMRNVPFKHKVVIAGNHDISMEAGFYERSWKRFGHKKQLVPSEEIAKLEGCCTYLHDKETCIEGIRIYGSPYQAWFYDWAFNLARGEECKKKWETVPAGIDILITHGPPMGRGDTIPSGTHEGDVDLLEEIRTRIHPKVAVFGHFHDGYGISFDGETVYINPSSVDEDYKPTNPPIVFDYPIPSSSSAPTSKSSSSTISSNASSEPSPDQTEMKSDN